MAVVGFAREGGYLISNPFHEEAGGYVLAKGCGGIGEGGISGGGISGGGISGGGGNLILLNRRDFRRRRGSDSFESIL